MRQGVGKGIIAVLAALLVWAPGALAATPEAVYQDLADNGQLDRQYTEAELRAFLQSASVQGYGNPVVATPGAITPAAPVGRVAGTSKTIVKAAPTATPAANVAGVQSPVQAPVARTASAGTLPFTGAELGLFALVGSALLLGGILLRASARQR
jgi:hypothetical protein